MSVNYEKINDLLTKVNGSAFSTSGDYYSSTVRSAATVWYMKLSDVLVNTDNVTRTYRVRLVQDL